MSKIVQTPTNIKNRTRKAMQRGFSNVQIAIGILITVILLLGSLSGYQYIQQAKVNNEVAMITDLRAATIRYGMTAGAFAGTDDVALLNGLNFFDSAGLHVDATSTPVKVTNQWGASVAAVGSADVLTFTFTSIPSSACAEIAPKVMSIVKTLTVAGDSITKTSTPAEIRTACTKGSTGAVVMAYAISR